MTETVYKYKPKPSTDAEKSIVVDPPPRVIAAETPAPTATVPTVKVVTGTDGRRALSKGLKDLWATNPALHGNRTEEERIGRTVEAPAYRQVAERTNFGPEMRREARRLGLRNLLQKTWGTGPEEE